MLQQDHYKHLTVKSQFIVYALALTVSLGAFVFGYSLACISQLQHLLKINNRLSDYESNIQITLITSAFAVGTILGSLSYKNIVDLLGDRKTLLISDVIVSVGIILQAIKLSCLWIIGPRLLIGYGIGVSAGVIPLYLNSLAPIKSVGKFGSMNQILINLGTFVSFVFGLLVNDGYSKGQYAWRLVMVFPILFSFARIIVLLFVFPFDNIETHISNHEDQKIQKYCDIIYSNAQIDDIKMLKKPIKKKQLKSFFGRKKLQIAIVIIASNQLSGINGIFYYINQLLNSLERNNKQSQYIMIAIGFAQVVSCCFAGKNIDDIGKKPIFKYGQAIVIGILLTGSIMHYLHQLSFFSQTLFQVGMLILVFSHLIVMSFTLGPVCIIYASQIVTDTTFVLFTLNFLSMGCTFISELLIRYMGIGAMFLFFAVLSFIAFLYLEDKLIETKGLTKEEIFLKYNQMITEQFARQANSKDKIFIPDSDPDHQEKFYEKNQQLHLANQLNKTVQKPKN